MMAEGFSMEEVGRELGISWLTVRKHCEDARRRLKVRNTTHAVAELLRRGEIL